MLSGSSHDFFFNPFFEELEPINFFTLDFPSKSKIIRFPENVCSFTIDMQTEQIRLEVFEHEVVNELAREFEYVDIDARNEEEFHAFYLDHIKKISLLNCRVVDSWVVYSLDQFILEQIVLVFKFQNSIFQNHEKKSKIYSQRN